MQSRISMYILVYSLDRRNFRGIKSLSCKYIQFNILPNQLLQFGSFPMFILFFYYGLFLLFASKKVSQVLHVSCGIPTFLWWKINAGKFTGKIVVENINLSTSLLYTSVSCHLSFHSLYIFFFRSFCFPMRAGRGMLVAPTGQSLHSGGVVVCAKSSKLLAREGWNH